MLENKELSNYLGSHFFQINEYFVRVLGASKAIWITNLFSYRDYLRQENNLPDDDFFYLKQRKIEIKTGISCDRQSEFIKFFVSLGVLEIDKRGLPAQNYYRVHPDVLIRYTQIENESFESKIKEKYKEEDEERHDKAKDKKKTNKIQSLVISPEQVPTKGGDIYNIKEKNIKEKKLSSKDDNSAERLKDVFSNYEPESRDLFEFWNSLDNLPHHKTNSKKFKTIMNTLDRQVNRHRIHNVPIDEIYNAMYRYNTLFAKDKTGNTKYRLWPTSFGHKVDLDQFFKLTNNFLIEKIKENKNNWIGEKIIGSSWFDECYKGQEYLLATYGSDQTRLIKTEAKLQVSSEDYDKYAASIEDIREKWEAAGLDGDGNTSEDRKNFTIALKVFSKFNKVNGAKIHWRGTTDQSLATRASWLIDGLIHSGTRSASTEWLYSEKTYQKFLSYVKSEDLLRGTLVPYDQWINSA